MQRHDILVIGASAGGVEALKQLVQTLPEDLPAAVLVVLHVAPHSTSQLPKILNSYSVLSATHPQDGEPIQHGHIYIAPPDYHLIVKRGYIHLARGPKENNTRPAIDVLFRSAARVYGPRVVAVVLSGTLDDGTAGLVAVKKRGGVAVVQDPDEALFEGMPRSAIENVAVDYILPVSEIAPLLVELADKPTEEQEAEPVSSEMETETDMAELELEAMQKTERPGNPSPYACPDCGGVLWELDEDKLIRFRCRTGHAYSTGSLMASQSEQLEEALWNALRALEEKAALALRMAKRARDKKQPYSAQRFQEQGENSQQRATLVRKLLLKGEGNGELSMLNGQLVGGQSLAPALVKGSVRNLPIQPARDNLEPILEQPIEDNNSDLKVVALCASAGGLQALSKVLSKLPVDFPAAITVVQHLAPHYPSHLADILSRRTALNVKQAEEGDRLRPGTVYIAPPDQHLLVNSDCTLTLSHSKLVHFVRPSADLLFESVAASFKQQAIAVVLTGTGSDGAMGVQAIKEMGGKAIAQNEATSEFFGMPKAAIDTGSIDLVVPLNEIAATLVNLVTTTNDYEQFGAEPGI